LGKFGTKKRYLKRVLRRLYFIFRIRLKLFRKTLQNSAAPFAEVWQYRATKNIMKRLSEAAAKTFPRLRKAENFLTLLTFGRQ